MFKLYLEPENEFNRQYHITNEHDSMICAACDEDFMDGWLDKFEAGLMGDDWNPKEKVTEFNYEYLGDFNTRQEVQSFIRMHALMFNIEFKLRE
ncbi:hypothetical protein PYDG_00020 [Pseudoalteromonas phage pYD6-A]|uniref:Uncharacterized protein n=1 Tax=Pseudoalteromonas phage pYD6-A TaxID=754052 RepID=M4SMG0_9CAUD|nr:hypothetical protein PYDG_00020 [Pseudoalteromonas phage pYD6-A]AGH57552.1 hypothetical protein PYDG_00020 [Pseudoalteromonas phage pYD6-A]